MKKTHRLYQLAVIFIFGIAVLLRFLLAFVNTEANDDHLLVTEMIASQEKLPVGGDCRECFSPKLYHLTLHKIFQSLAIADKSVKIIIAQLLNAAAGILTLFLIFAFLNQRQITDKIKLISFAFIALNPRFISINGQATNDSFAILFASGALYYLTQYIRSWRSPDLFIMTLFTVLAGLSKGTALFLFPLIVFIILIKLKFGQTRSSQRKTLLFDLLIFGTVWLAVVPWGGQYRETRALFTLDIYQKRSGYVSVRESFMTFAFFDLIKEPYIDQGGETRPSHRTSLWTQLYGRTYFIQFNMWPPSWIPKPANALFNLARLIFILALWPSLLFLTGIIIKIRDWSVLISKRLWEQMIFDDSGIQGICLLMALVFIMLNSYLFKDLGSMKLIYILPFLLSFTYFFSEGCAYYYKKFASHKLMLVVSDIFLWFLAGLFCFDVLYLIRQLTIS